MEIKPGMKILGRFEILKEYRGGSFRVFFAIDRQEDKARVLKFLPIEIKDNDKARKDLVREAGLLGKVKSEYTVDVYNCYILDDGEVFMTMEWAKGGDLHAYLKKNGPLSWTKTKELLLQILEGLDEIHNRNIIHRDIKPGNILFSQDGRPMLADFGLSKILSDRGEVSQRTSVGGTPEYMAPEAIKGEKLSFATDIYSIGCLAWQMLTGHPPFESKDGNPVPVMYSHINDKPNFSEIPPEAFEFLNTCLEKNPQDRISNIAKLIELLNETPNSEKKPDIKNKGNRTRTTSRKTHELRFDIENFKKTKEHQRMKKRAKQTFIALIIAIIAVLIIVGLYPILTGSGRITVSLDGSTSWDNIQSALLEADDKDTVYVAPGRYNEEITFPKDKIVYLKALEKGNASIYSSSFSPVTFSEGSEGGIYDMIVQLSGKGDLAAIEIDNTSPTIQGVELLGLDKTGTGIRIKGNKSSPSISLTNIEHFQTGLSAEQGADCVVDNTNIFMCTNGLWAKGSNTRITALKSNIHHNINGFLTTDGAKLDLDNNISLENHIGYMDVPPLTVEKTILGQIRYFEDAGYIVGTLNFIGPSKAEKNRINRLLLEDMNPRICSNCSLSYHSVENLPICPRCHYDERVDAVICPDCLTPNPPEARFCKKCRYEFSY